jgi:hypothetical protein
MIRKQKLELTWIGKDEQTRLEDKRGFLRENKKEEAERARD